MKQTETQNPATGETYTIPRVEIIGISAENGFAQTGNLSDVFGEDW